MFCIPFSSFSEKMALEEASAKLKQKGLTEWEHHIWQFIYHWFDPDSGSIKIYTSGSTDEPKLIEHSKGAMLNSARMTCDALKLKINDKAFLCLPANRIAGMMMIVRCIWSKMDLYCIRPSVDPLERLHEKDRFELGAFTPMQLAGINTDAVKRKKLEVFNKVIIGGEEVPPPLVEALKPMNCTAYATFGMTETISHIALRRLNGPDPQEAFHVFPGVKIMKNEKNCLVIEAPNLGVRHLETHDAVALISPTQFIWLGRTDNVINSGGVKIFPEQIEAQLKPVLKFPFFITAMPNKQSGQEVAIAIEHANLSLKETNTLKIQFRSLGKLQSPKTILTIPKFERTDNGKIRRKESLKHVAMKIAL